MGRLEQVDDELLDLFKICRLKRPKDSKGELELINEFLIPAGLNRDDFGNWFIRVGEAPILWSSHTDTVHHLTDEDDKYQSLWITEDGMLSANQSSCLGADNGAGVWIMLNMLKRGVEGLYVFHRQEETGGCGSRYISASTPELVDGIKFAIAFDRKGTDSIITHQLTRCCSDKFAKSLSEELLRTGGLSYRGDDTGVFTDTANYTALIPECTNLSVGFYQEHTYQESLDTKHAKALLDAICQLDVNNLVVERHVDDATEWGWSRQNSYWNHGYDPWEDEDDDELQAFQSAQGIIRRHPDKVYKVLKDWGVVDQMIADMGFL